MCRRPAFEVGRLAGVGLVSAGNPGVNGAKLFHSITLKMSESVKCQLSVTRYTNGLSKLLLFRRSPGCFFSGLTVYTFSLFTPCPLPLRTLQMQEDPAHYVALVVPR